MKYVEPIKSFLLFFLVCLSLVLTVMIWNYKPNHQVFEETPTEDILIGEPVEITEILKPYRSIIRIEDEFKGSFSTKYFDDIYAYFETVKADDITLVNNFVSFDQINELMYTNNRVTLNLFSEVPLHSFTKILGFESAELPEISFDRIIIDLNNLAKDRELTVLFLNTSNQTLYRTKIENQSENRLKKLFLEGASDLTTFEEMKRPGLLSLFISDEPIEAVKYMYYVNDMINEVPIDQFKKTLFQNENIVKNITENVVTERYMDNMSFMTVDTKNRIINYVYPSSEGIEDILASRLLNETYNYVNDHGGFNSDYRLSTINPEKHLVEYQLFIQGYPVFSSSTTTKISTTWGDSQVHKYRRAYYILERDIPSEMKMKELQSSKKIVETYVNDIDTIKDIVRGYYLYQNEDLGVFELEPEWFVLRDKVWERIKTENIGGIANGLE